MPGFTLPGVRQVAPAAPAGYTDWSGLQALGGWGPQQYGGQMAQILQEVAGLPGATVASKSGYGSPSSDTMSWTYQIPNADSASLAAIMSGLNSQSFHPHSKSGGLLGELTPILDIASLFFPAVLPFAEGANVVQGIENKNPLQAIAGAYGLGATEGLLPTPSGIWNSLTGGGGTPAAGATDFSSGGMSIPGSAGPMSTTQGWLDSMPSGGLPAAGADFALGGMSVPGDGGPMSVPGGGFPSAISPTDTGGLIGITPTSSSGIDPSMLSAMSLGGLRIDPALTAATTPGGGSLWDTISGGFSNLPTTMEDYLSKPKNLFNLGTGAYGLIQGQQLKGLASKLGQQADPFAGQRAQYGQMLQQLMANPSNITKLPGYAAGLEAVNRSAAAAGTLGGGAGALADSAYGSNLFNQTAQLYGNLAGAGATPGAGAGAQLSALSGGMGMNLAGLSRIGSTLFPGS